ncbi:MAG: hypothetical protein E7665_01490 [Ruminococcaceae bacterium]|nr:hypothetical protein [Oscillospiraceae bacterium]
MKRESCYYNSFRKANALNNIKKYPFIKEECDKIIKEADGYLEKYSLENIRFLPASQSLYRSSDVNHGSICPVCSKIMKVHLDTDAVYTPADGYPLWKIKCKKCGTVYPSNDFESYYKSALDERGFFCPEKGDRTLLKNTLYPEKGEGWCVDDGYGYIDEDGEKFVFVAVFTHWYLWRGIIVNILRSCSKAYLFTGEQKYADAVLVLLDRIADFYPGFSGEGHRPSNGFFQSDGGSGRGKILGRIWECWIAYDFAAAYDAVKNGLSSMTDKALGVSCKDSADEIADNIEENILREIYRCLGSAEIHGNSGMHQKALAMAAIALDGGTGESRRWLEYLFDPSNYRVDAVDGADMASTFVNRVDRDGFGDECSPSYNNIWPSNYIDVAEILSDVKPEDGDKYIYDVYTHPKFRKMLASPLRLVMSDSFFPHIGDVGAFGNPGLIGKAEMMMKAFVKYKEPFFAKAAYLLNGNTTNGLVPDIFTCDVGEILKQIEEISVSDPLETGDKNLTGYGYTSLKHRYGKDLGNPETSLGIYYGKNTGHGHKDTQNLFIYAYNTALTPDIGYPEYCNSVDKHRRYWTNHTLSHNTVIVDREKQSKNVVGRPSHIFNKGDIKLISVDAPDAYDQTSVYRRTSLLIKIDDENSYIADVFKVTGGSEHAYAFHFAETDSMKTSGVSLIPQVDEEGRMTGTLLGADVPFGSGDDPTGYQFLKNVQRDTAPSSEVSFDGRITDTWKTSSKENIHLRYTLFADCDEIVFAEGVPSRKKVGNPKKADYIYAYRRGENLSSIYTAVYEPYSGESKILSIEKGGLSGGEGVCLNVLLKDGRRDTLIIDLDNDKTVSTSYGHTMTGFVSVIREYDGGEKSVFTFDVKKLDGEERTGAYIGKITGFTETLSSDNYIDITADEFYDEKLLCGRCIHIDTSEYTNGVYEIFGAKRLENGDIRLDIGDVTTVKAYKDPAKKDMTLVFNIEKGAGYRIPLDL